MTLSSTVIACSVIAILLLFGVGIGVPYYYIMGRFDQIEKRVDALWDYLIRGAHSEAVAKGLGNINSPFILNEATRVFFRNYIGDLRKFYEENCSSLSDNEIFVILDKEFGDHLMKDIGIPNNLTHGSVITAAVEIAKEPTIERDTDVSPS
jgi:hypothetical protein